jgi:hypothetical protein
MGDTANSMCRDERIILAIIVTGILIYVLIIFSPEVHSGNPRVYLGGTPFIALPYQ